MSYSLVVFAVPPIGGYTPGATLDPDCAPLDPDCSVAIETLTFDSPLTKTGSVISLPAASATVDGYLSATDYNAFADKEDSFGAGTSTDYLRGDKTWVTLDTSVVPENGNLYWTNNRFDTRLAATTSIPNLQTVGTITSGIWHGSQIMDAYVSDSITASNYIPLSQKGAANGVATLDGSGKITASQLSSFSLSDTFVVNSEAEMLNLLSAELGDVAIRLDENKSYILTTNDPTNIANWQQIITPLDFILSVNGQTGAVNLTTTDIPEGLNLYYTDSRVDDYLNTVKGVANGVASLDANGKIPTNQLGSIILNETHVVADIPEMLALTSVANGDLAVVTSTSQTYVLADDNDPSNINSWVEIVNGAPVTSVNGQVGTVNLTTTNISEGSNQYFTNARARSALSATGPLSYNSTTGVFGITQANTITNGFLSATDWNTFNNKQNALTFGNVTASSNPEITITGGTGAIIGTGLDIIIPDASDTVRGLITTGAQNFGGVKNFADGLGVGDSAPSTLFSVGNGGLFQVDNSGDLVKIKNVAYSWPGTQGAADSVLVNNGSGGLSWASNGVTSLNGLTDATQTFTTSTTGTDFSISSSAGIHTFNFPTASATARGALSTTKYTEFNNKPFVDTTYNNIYVGSISAGSVMNGAGGAINNIVMGYQSGDTLSTGNNNTLLGYQSGKNITTGVSYSFFAGYQTGLSATGATNSNFIGRSAGSGATSASFANFFGRSAGLSATGAQYGVFIGDNAGNTASGSSNATFIGQNAGYQATTAPYSTFIGTSAGYQATGATTANFIGYAAGYTASDADYSNFIGRGAGNAAANAYYSNFFGFQAGYNAANAANSIFIGKNAGNADTVNNTVSGSSIAIGDSAGTGGFSNSIAIGASAVNTATNQFLIGSTYTNFNVRGINYVWPSTQAAGSGYTLTNDGSGNLSWSTGLSIGGSSGQLQYNNGGSLAGVSGISYNGVNLDANDATFRIVNYGDTTKRAIFDVGYIDPATTRTFTFPNYGGTFALATGISGGQTIYGGTSASQNLTLGSTSNATKGKIIFGTSAYDEVNNRLGIGTTAPTYTLDVTGDIRSSGSYRFSGSPTISNASSALNFNADNGFVLNANNAASNLITVSNAGVYGFTSGFTSSYTNPWMSLGLLRENSSQWRGLIGYPIGIHNLAGDISFTQNTGVTYGAVVVPTETVRFKVGGYVGIGQSSPTAVLHLKAGTATASTAPLKFTAGTNLTTPEAGVVEYTTNNFWLSTNTTNRIRFGNGGSGSAGATNMVIGVTAGTNLTTGSSGNTYFGTSAGAGQTNGIGNTGIGSGALATHTGYTGNTAIGEGAMYYGSGGINVAIGDYAMFADSSVNTSNYSVAIGGNSFYKKSSGDGGIAIGYNAGYTVSSAAKGIYIGYNVVNGGIHTGTNTIAIGEEAGKILTSGGHNTLIGYQSGATVTTGTMNNFMGYQSGYNTNSATGYANFIGYQAGYGTSTNGGVSNFIGYQAGYGAGYSVQNNFIGNQAGYGANNLADANFIGTSAGTNATTANRAVFIGQNAGHTATNGADTVSIGTNAGRNATGAIESIFIGKNAGYNSVSTGVTGDYNIGLGTETGKSLTTGAHNTFLGYQAGRNITTGTGNFMVGYQAGYNGGDSYNNFLGYTAGYGASTVQQSNFIGPNAGTNATFGSYSNFLGPNAGSGATFGSYSNYFGNAAGLNATSATSSNFFGSNAGNTATNATLSNFIGNAAGYQATNASYANFFGSDAGRSAAGAIDSIFIGQNSGRNATDAVESIFLGKNSGYNSTGSGITGDYNIGIGTGTGLALTTGAYNTLIGWQAGDTITTGSNNVIIGKDIDAQSATTDNQLSIQNIIFGTGNSGTGTTVSTGKIGIGVSPATYRFEVSDASNAGAISSFTNSDGTCTLDPGDVSGWSCPSDVNLKKDIETLTSGSLDNILTLRPVTYRLKNEDSSTDLSTGLIAQEVQTVFPKLVKTQIDGTLALNYGGLTPYIISAIQEMNLKITEIGVIEKPNSWRDALIAWFANTANGITEFFSKKVSTEELCVTDSVGQTCITRSQLDALLNGQGIMPQSPAPEPSPNPTPDPTPDPGTDSNDVISDDSVPVSDPEPTPAPDPTPAPEPVPDPTPAPDPGV